MRSASSSHAHSSLSSCFLLCFLHMPVTTPFKCSHMLEAANSGQGQHEIARHFEVSYTTVGHLLKKYMMKQTLYNLPKTEHPRKLTSSNEAHCASLILQEKTPNVTTIQEQFYLNASVSTIRRALKRQGLHTSWFCIVPLLSKCHMQARMAFA